jgi:hypothetical protein
MLPVVVAILSRKFVPGGEGNTVLCLPQRENIIRIFWQKDGLLECFEPLRTLPK